MIAPAASTSRAVADAYEGYEYDSLDRRGEILHDNHIFLNRKGFQELGNELVQFQDPAITEGGK